MYLIYQSSLADIVLNLILKAIKIQPWFAFLLYVYTCLLLLPYNFSLMFRLASSCLVVSVNYMIKIKNNNTWRIWKIATIFFQIRHGII